MSLKARLAARGLQLLAGQMMRPTAALEVFGTDVPAPQPLLIPTAAGPVRSWVYRPRPGGDFPGSRLPVYVNFHGGGFVVRRPEYDDHICRALVAGTGCVVVNVDYDVAPQRPFPVAPRQAYGAVAWVVRHAREYGWDGSRLAVGGQSAGGNLAAGVCLRARETGAFAPDLQVLVYPPLDLLADPATKRSRAVRPVIPSRIARVFNGAYLRTQAQAADPLASPVFAPDLAGLPPTLVITAELDPLRDEGDLYAVRLTEAGVPVVHRTMIGVDHGFAHAGPLEPVQEALSLMVAAVNDVWSGTRHP